MPGSVDQSGQQRPGMMQGGPQHVCPPQEQHQDADALRSTPNHLAYDDHFTGACVSRRQLVPGDICSGALYAPEHVKMHALEHVFPGRHEPIFAGKHALYDAGRYMLQSMLYGQHSTTLFDTNDCFRSVSHLCNGQVGV